MNEYTTGYTAAGSIAGLAIMAALYMSGGRSGKWKRRFVASFIQALNTNVCFAIMGIWQAWLLLTWPIISIGLHFGYGGDTAGQKIIRRSIYCVANLAVAGIFIWRYGTPMLWVFIPNVGVAVWSIYLGVKNPLYAPAEEVFVCVLLYLMTNAYPFVASIH